MDELMMYNYLRNKGIGDMSEHEFMNRFREFMNKYRRSYKRHRDEDDFISPDDDYLYRRRHNRPEEFMDMFDRENEFPVDYMMNKDRAVRYMRNSISKGDHFSESEAEHIVSKMYHVENGRKYSGEKFDMRKAKEVCERYRGILPSYVATSDVYVAINSQYHDYIELFRNWFTEGVEQKIIESAIVFWFKDIDAKSENKVVGYFREY